MKNALSTIFDATRTTYHNPDVYEICGVKILHKDRTGSSWDEWEPIFKERLPSLDEAGWLDGLNRIEISDDFVIGDDKGGMYRGHTATIAIKNHPDPDGQPRLVGDTKEYVLLHEMVHHEHMTTILDNPAQGIRTLNLDRIPIERTWSETQKEFYREVSKYASTNLLEAVAETACGLMYGYEYNDTILDAYDEFGGPEPIEW